MNPETLRCRILDYTKREMYQHGADGLTMDDIARGMKMSKRTLYKLFPSKTSLFRVCLSDFANGIRSRIQQKHAFKTAAALALVAAFVVTMLYSRAVLTELNQQIAAQTNALADAQSENTRLSAQLDAKVSLRNVEEYATQALGMVSIDKSQITYVDLSEGDKIELTMDSPRLSLIDRIRVAISNAKNPED